MKNKYRNLWHKDLNVPQPEFYKNEARCILEHRGFKVFKLFNEHYDFVLEDACVTQRAGVSKAKEVIDSILDGKEVVSRQVKDYFNKKGYNFKTYSDFQ